MGTAPVSVIDRTEVGELGDLLGAGGQARVFAAPALALPDAPGPLVFKRYHDGQHPPHGLGPLVMLRNRLPDPDRALLDRFTAWPLRVVTDAGRTCGVVLPRIPEPFFQERVLPGTGRVDRGLREVQNLFVEPNRALRLGMPAPDVADRLRLCREFAMAMAFVHHHGMVLGDVNSRNAVFRLAGAPAVMLVDCDAVRFRGSAAVVRQLNTPDWEPPEGNILSQATDRYKLGLFVLRCLGPGPQASVARDPERVDHVLDRDGAVLLRAALGPRGRRPPAGLWVRHIDRLLAPPEPAVVDTPVVPAPVTIPARRRDPATGLWVPAG